MNTTTRKPLRLWPGATLAALLVVSFFGVPALMPDAELPIGLLGAVLAALGIVMWWLLFSRAPWIERAAAIPLGVGVALILKALAHPSIAGAGQGFYVYLLSSLLMTVGLVAWAAGTRNLQDTARRVALPMALLLASAPILIIRTAGVTSTSATGFEYHWRWTPTPEELLLAQTKDEALAPPPATATVAPAVDAPAPAPESSAAPAALVKPTEPAKAARAVLPPAEWPGFRGPRRDGVIHDLRINTDWTTAPPVEMWQRAIGPGWASFAVRGDLLYTQEQRGDSEMVTCYRVSSGQPVWRHGDPIRFYESNGGAGPRGTPTLDGDRVYAFGATGLLKALDAITGNVAWIANVSADAKRAVPFWGFASSPVVVDDVVIIAAAGTLVGYDAATGTMKWKGPSYGGSYSSPHVVALDGVEQVVLLGGPGAVSVNAADGAVLWEHKWEPGPMVQPAVTEDGDIIINNVTATGGVATRRLHVTRAGGGWSIEERWTSNGLKPNFNDFVVHKGHAYGFDNNILAAINLETGQRVWKGGRYGNGQMVLLKEQDLLLVTSEDGELALVSATPEKYTEVAKIPILEGKTWNHPVIVRDILLVRNGEQMKAFRLPVAADTTLSRLSR